MPAQPGHSGVTAHAASCCLASTASPMTRPASTRAGVPSEARISASFLEGCKESLQNPLRVTEEPMKRSSIEHFSSV